MIAVAVVFLLILLRQIRVLRYLTTATTAETSRRWALVAVAGCLLAVGCRHPLINVSPAVQSLGQYCAAVLLLTPFVGILGARRPSTAAWPWFVILPLILVLQWPLLSEVLAGDSGTSLQVPTPTFLGFAFVLVMGVGNYFGTLNTGAASITGVAILLMALPVTEWAAFENLWYPVAACALLLFASALLPGRYSDPQAQIAAETENLSDLWNDFRDLYGTVWAKRVMDRVNQFAAREHWSVRVSLDGFVAIDSTEDSSSSLVVSQREIDVLCWVLRRFVDEAFLRRYLTADRMPRPLTRSTPEATAANA